MDKASDPKYSTTDGKPPDPGHENSSAPKPINLETGQHGAYWVLSEVERAKGFIRPVRRTYGHVTCGTTTTMGVALAETYSRDPTFYSSTFCVFCQDHFPVAEFLWVEDDINVTPTTVGS
jgi:hypothetical protein